jgi:polyhydroxyalkanoate synthase
VSTGSKGTATPNAALKDRWREALDEGLEILARGPQVETGLSPKVPVWTRNKTTLYRYEPTTASAHRTPVLLVYALINKPYVLDLRPDNSLVRHLLDHGYDVFLLDWGTPGWEDRETSLDELVGEHLPRAVERMLRAKGASDYTLVGYCMGGTMATMHAALRPEGVRNLVALTTPIDFAEGGTFAVWSQPRHLDVSAVVVGLGNVPAEVVNVGSKMLKPVTNFVLVQTTMWERLLARSDMSSWLAINKWINDGVPFPGAAFAQWVEGFYQRNLLTAGEMRIGGTVVDLSKITASLLTIAGSQDHIVPPQMARPLNALVSSTDSQYAELDAGHVGLLVGSKARTTLWPRITDWLEPRSG